MSQGFIQLYRKIIDEWFWNNPKLAHLMVTLILTANHKPKEVSFQCKKRLVRRGETIRATRKLELLTGMSKSTISRMLKVLCDENEIEIIATKASHIKILRYDYFLSSDFDENWDKDGTGMSLNNNDNNNTNTIADYESAKEEFFNDEESVNKVMNDFGINSIPKLEDEIDHLIADYLEKGKSTKNFLSSINKWLIIRRKNLEKYGNKIIAESQLFD